MGWYGLAFLAGLAVDSIPVFAPPAWTVLAVLMVAKKLNPYAVAALGAVGSTIGRYALSLYLPKLSGKVFSKKRNQNVAFLGKKLEGRNWQSFLFVLVYSLTPLSTTALFTAAGIARVNPLPILPAFCIGKFASDLVMILSGQKAYRAAMELFHGHFSGKTIFGFASGMLIIVLVLFIDWRELLEHKKLRLTLKR